MKINKSELQAALEKVKPGLASKEIIEQATSFAFMGDRVVTYNDEISISHPVKGLNIRGAVKAQNLYAYLNKIRRDEIDIEIDEKQVKISAGRAKAGLVFEAEVRLPIEEVGKIGKWKKLPDSIVPALKCCYPCASKDMSMPVLTCVFISQNSVQASDSYQIIKYTLTEKVPTKKGILIPASAVHELVKYDIKEFSEGEGWVHFRTDDGTIFSCRTPNGIFPEIDKFLEFEGVEIPFPRTALNALERAEIFAKNNVTGTHVAPVTVCVSPGQIKFSAQDEAGWFEESIKTKYQGDAVTFITGVDFLLSLLKQSPTCVYANDRIKFTGEKWVHVIAVLNTEVSK